MTGAEWRRYRCRKRADTIQKYIIILNRSNYRYNSNNDNSNNKVVMVFKTI